MLPLFKQGTIQNLTKNNLYTFQTLDYLFGFQHSKKSLQPKTEESPIKDIREKKSPKEDSRGSSRSCREVLILVHWAKEPL